MNKSFQINRLYLTISHTTNLSNKRIKNHFVIHWSSKRTSTTKSFIMLNIVYNKSFCVKQIILWKLFPLSIQPVEPPTAKNKNQVQTFKEKDICRIIFIHNICALLYIYLHQQTENIPYFLFIIQIISHCRKWKEMESKRNGERKYIKLIKYTLILKHIQHDIYLYI